jgi:transposase
MGVAEAAVVFGLSERHTWRILAQYRRKGAAALAHGNRGHRPPNATSEGTKEQIIMLARTHYTGVNHTHLTELLAERDGIRLARSTVRGILLNAGLASPRHRRLPRHRCRRERMPREGVLVQIDGSYHNWLEDRGPWLTLLLSVDDATGTIPYALFREHEDAQGYFRLLWGMCQSRGIPLAIYTDRHSVFQPPPRSYETLEESLSKERGRTQVGRALRELGVCQVFARSPEAKGRVERMAGTFQDRLVSELRLAGASTLADANNVLWQFLPGFNERFGVPPPQTESAYRPLRPDPDLAGILCFKHECKVARDNTVKYHLRTLQLLPSHDHPSYAGAHAEIQERLDGSVVVCQQGRAIPTQEAPPKPNVLRAGNVNWNRLAPLPKWLTANGTIKPPPKHPLLMLRRGPTPLKQAKWKAVQAAKRRGVPILRIARQLGMNRTTVRRYLAAPSPPVYSTRRPRQEKPAPAILTESLVINT